MRLALTPDQETLQAELRTYFASLAADIEAERSDESSYTRSIRRMGQDGWLGMPRAPR